MIDCYALLQLLFFYFSWNMGMFRLILDWRKKKQDFFLVFTGMQIAYQPITSCPCTIHKYDILCISEAYVDSSVSVDDTTLSLLGYNVVWSDHLKNVKRGGVCLYYKENLSLRLINVPFLSQCVLCKVTLQSQKGYAIVCLSILKSISSWIWWILIKFWEST